MDNELRVTSGTAATISYECTFEDNNKKTVTIGNYRTADISTANLKTNIKAFNASVPAGFSGYFISPKSTADNTVDFKEISGATVTVTQRNVLI